MLDRRRPYLYNIEWVKRARWRRPTRPPKTHWVSWQIDMYDDMILAIVGSATQLTDVQYRHAETIIDGVLDRYHPAKVISGGAPGIDTMAKIAAERRGIPFEEFLPAAKNWAFGFKPRNMKIAKACTALVRIVATQSTTYGSGWTRDRAKDLGKVTEEFVI